MSGLDALFDAAERIRARAYAPYSDFLVGAAIRAPDGAIHAGCNVENAAYPLGSCAEAAAIAAMVATGAMRIAEIAIVGGPAGGGPMLCPPCGGCRQRIREFADAATLIHLREADGRVVTVTVEQILPFSFGPEYL